MDACVQPLLLQPSPTSCLRCTHGVVGFLHTYDYSPTLISLHILVHLIVYVRTVCYVHVVKYINYILLLMYMYCTVRVRYRVLSNDVPFRAHALYVRSTLYITTWFTRICTITVKHPPSPPNFGKIPLLAQNNKSTLPQRKQKNATKHGTFSSRTCCIPC
jgi:hypothetical protein